MIFLLFSVPFGMYALALYKVLKKAPEKIGYLLPVMLTMVLPATYLPITETLSNNILDKNIELLPIIGFLTMFIVFLTPASASTIIPIPIIDKLRNSELTILIASTLSFAYVILTGFAEVMGIGESYTVTKITIVSDIYLTCFKLFAISSIVYVVALEIQRLDRK